MKCKGALAVIIILLALLVSLGIGVGGASSAGATSALDELGTEAAAGTAFTYQGQLRDEGGTVNDACDLQFTLWDAAAGGAQVGNTILLEDVLVEWGLFTARLDFGAAAFRGQARYLEVGVACPAGSALVPLPRQELTASPYALYALSAWSLTGNSGTTPGTNYLGTSDNVALEIRVNGTRALRLEPGSSPNLLGGYSGNLLTAGVTGATVSGGGSAGYANRVTDSWGAVGGGTNNRAGDNAGTVSDASYATVGGGLGNTAQRESATIGGGAYNNVLGVYGTVAGGDHNHAYGPYSTVAGGGWNEVTGGGSYAFIGGGYENSATAPYVTVGGGSYNSASASHGTVGGGWSNAATVQYATVGGGYDNTASNEYTTVGGGSTNTASQLDATVAGGSHNTASGARATAGGGYGNTASGESATVGGGQWNTASATFATISGGGPSDLGSPETTNNRVSDKYGTVGGGGGNWAGIDDGDPNSQAYATVGGGASNRAGATYATVGGGRSNGAWGESATVGGGFDNSADANYATVGGGYNNTANGWYATVGGGEANYGIGYGSVVSGGLSNWARGQCSMVPGGYHNLALGDYSFTAGFNAVANNAGCFVWADANYDEVPCNVTNRWVARASGGVWFYTNPTLSSGVYVSAGGTSWNGVSDRATKENFAPVDTQALLETLASLPVQEYNLKSQDPAIRHVGVVAQDFAAFGYGESDLAINMQDADGVALAAIQGLYERLQALEAENDELAARLAALEAGQDTNPSPTRLPSRWLLMGGGVLAVGAVVGRTKVESRKRKERGG